MELTADKTTGTPGEVGIARKSNEVWGVYQRDQDGLWQHVSDSSDFRTAARAADECDERRYAKRYPLCRECGLYHPPDTQCVDEMVAEHEDA